MGAYRTEVVSESEDSSDFDARMVQAFHRGLANKGKGKGQVSASAGKNKGGGQEKTPKVKKGSMSKEVNRHSWQNDGSNSHGGGGSGAGGGGSITA